MCGRERCHNTRAVTAKRSEPVPAASFGVGTHHLGIVPPETGVARRRLGDDEDRRRNTQVSQQWPRVIEDAGVAVVEGHGRYATERFPMRPAFHALVEPDDLAVACEPSHLSFEGGQRHMEAEI